MRRIPHLLPALIVVACAVTSGAPTLAPPAQTPAARPGFTTTWTADLVNTTGSHYEVTALSIEPDGDDQGAFWAVRLAEEVPFPVVLGPGDSVPLRFFFSASTLGERRARLQAITFLTDYTVGGGGCSAGPGREAPEETLEVVWADVVASTTSDAPFEDCGDGQDNDADGAIDCEDVACELHPDCVVADGCAPTGTLGCGEQVDSTTAGRANELETYCGGGDTLEGREEIWTHLATSDDRVILTLDGQGWDPGLILLEGTFAQDGTVTCDPAACAERSITPGDEELLFEPIPGTLYFLVVDGAADEAGPYTLSMSCIPDTETDCSDGFDDDLDGDFDCDDADCADSQDCLAPPTCEPIEELGCGAVVSGVSGGPPSTAVVEQWCDEPPVHTGPESAWLFTTDRSTTVTVRASDLEANLDLVVMLENPELGCDPDLCVEEPAWSPGDADEEATFEAFAGQRYILALDGVDGAESPFRMTVSCSP